MSRRALIITVLCLVTLGVAFASLVATGRVGIYSARSDTERPTISGLQVITPLEGSRGAHRADDTIPTQAPLTNLDLVPDDPDWWTSRCAGFFSALMRAQLDLRFRPRPLDEPAIFPALKDLPEDMNLLSASDPAATDQMRRYERSFPENPEDILADPLYLTDLPMCESVAKGLFPKP